MCGSYTMINFFFKSIHSQKFLKDLLTLYGINQMLTTCYKFN